MYNGDERKKMTKISHSYNINGIEICTIERDEESENPIQHNFVSIYDLLAELINEINQLRDELAKCSNK